jgi:hypothetical protein
VEGVDVADEAAGIRLNPVSLVLKNQKIEPQMNRMDADEEDENAVFICVFHLRPSDFICG